MITGNALYTAVQEMADALDDRYFAARAAEEFVKTGPIQVRESFAASHTLAEFLPFAVLEIDRQINNIRYSLQINAQLTLIRAERSFTPVGPVIQADAAVVSIWVTLLRLVVAEEFDPSRVSVTAQENAGIPPDLVPRSSFFKRKWNGVQIGFPSEWLKRPLDLHKEIPYIERGELQGISPREAVLKWMEQACLEGVGESSFGMNDLAHRLDVHPKSLQRTLARLGTSFREIRDEARRQKALEILGKDTSVLNEEIAELLGFSSNASFTRAFKRWTGVTPTKFRQNL
jgi:AraC-like DNA-binding protein